MTWTWTWITLARYEKYLPNFATSIKGALSGLTQFLAMESPLTMMKNAFYFTSKAFFVLKIFTFLSYVLVM